MRILFSSTPLDGHFRPLLPLARALAARGHHVTFATHSGWHGHVRAEGFDAVAAGPPHAHALALLEPHRPAIAALPPFERRQHLLQHLFVEGHAAAKLPELLEVGRRLRPDAIVYESVDFAAAAAAAVLGIAPVNHSFGAMVPFRSLAHVAKPAAALWRSVGAEPDEHAGAFRGLHVGLLPPSLVDEDPLGASVTLRPLSVTAEPPPAWLDDLGRPLVYVTLGTAFNRPETLRTLLDALGGSTAALVTTGRNVDPSSLGSVPANVRVQRFVPQAHVLPRSDAVVSHGGSGSFLGALAHGLPAVLVPQGADQFENAERGERAGAAVVVPPERLDAPAVAAALRRVLSEPSLVAAARRIEAEIAAMPSADEVAQRVEAYAAGG